MSGASMSFGLICFRLQPVPSFLDLRYCLQRRVILGCLAAAPPQPAGPPEAAAEAVATPPPAARSALRCLSLEAVWRLLLAARAAGGCATGQRPATAATPVDEVRRDRRLIIDLNRRVSHGSWAVLQAGSCALQLDATAACCPCNQRRCWRCGVRVHSSPSACSRQNDQQP